MAYQAGASPVKNDTTLYDCGVLAALWVSAFECLLHPGGKKDVGKCDVFRALDRVKFGFGATSERTPTVVRRLRARRYLLGKKGNKRTKGKPSGLLPRLYEQLYCARNSFLHGNRATERLLRAFGMSDRPPLIDLAPIIYRFAVLDLLPLPEQQSHHLRADINQQEWNDLALGFLLRATGCAGP
jgi:hypothetical protein